MSFHVSEGGLEGLLPSPRGVHRRPRAVASSGVTSMIIPPAQIDPERSGSAPTTMKASNEPSTSDRRHRIKPRPLRREPPRLAGTGGLPAGPFPSDWGRRRDMPHSGVVGGCEVVRLGVSVYGDLSKPGALACPNCRPTVFGMATDPGSAAKGRS